jgi:hypothetical protein
MFTNAVGIINSGERRGASEMQTLIALVGFLAGVDPSLGRPDRGEVFTRDDKTRRGTTAHEARR